MSGPAPAAFRPDCVVFVISQPYLSRGREQTLAEGLCRASPVPARCIRLEGTGPALPEALDELAAAGARAILVQPVGLPFSESLGKWLPGALAHWRRNAAAEVDVRLGDDPVGSPEVLATAAREMLTRSADAQPVAAAKPSLGPRGWDNPGSASDHVLVCAGPRCHFRDAPRLRMRIADELRRTGALRMCQVTEVSCLGPCNRGPLVAHYPDGAWYTLNTDEDVRRFVATVICGTGAADDLVAHRLPQRLAEVSV